MGRPLVIACSLLEDEVTAIMDEHGLWDDYDVSWIPNVHDTPKEMISILQPIVDEVAGRPYVMLTYGNCGNGLVGLTARDAPLVMPRYADCISILLSDRDDLDELRKNTYFLTRAWLESERSIDREYDKLVEDSGQEDADDIMEMLYGHYENLMLIDTGCYDVDAQMEHLDSTARKANMKPCTAKGTISVLERLLMGDWGDDFIRVEPGESVEMKEYFSCCDAERLGPRM